MTVGAPELRAAAPARFEALELELARIARTLHDDVQQLLASATIALEELRDDEARLEPRLAPVLARLDEATERVRDLARELRPTALDDLGLRPALELLARGMSRRGRLAVEVAGSNGNRLDPEHELALYRIAQQALTNVVRHSRARRAHITLRRAGRQLTLEVRDDGVGFDPGSQPPGLGLAGMRERAQRLGGRLTVVAAPGCGTVVTAVLPVEPGA